MAKGLIDTILDQVFDAEWMGRRGEKLTERELKWVKLFGRDGKVLRNVYVPKDNGETSEIDVLFITQKGIFVIESKNYSGWIFGNEADRSWTASLKGGHKERFYNPIRQNRSHVKWLGEFLGDSTPLFSIVVFSERCELKKVTVTSNVRVIKRDRLYATVLEIWEHSPDVANEEDVAKLLDRLQPLTEVSEAQKAAHIANIKQRYVPNKKSADKIATVDSSDAVQTNNPTSPICPRCGGALILRTAKKGPHAGNQFYGCSNFPKCRYTRND